ncbi:MAG: phosphoglucosamine mutase [Thermoplasmata archaeon]|nr:phosphoglucosamine mutase [Thermoplasmata archaeon]
MRMFGTNGIRGIANGFLDCGNLTKIGMSIASVLGPGPIAIACDTRISSDMLVSAVSAGIMAMGADVHDLGMVPTPALQYYVKTHDVTGGVMITASHNPPEFNGVKCVSSDGTECSKEEESRIEDAFDSDLETASWDAIGSRTVIGTAGEEYVDAIVSKADVDLIRKANIRLCLDCANGAGSNTTPLLMRRLGVTVVGINCNPDGRFPGHHSEPLERNLPQLMSLMKTGQFDLGAAHDGDADRCCFVTGSGRYIPGDVSLALLARGAVGNGGKAVTTVATSSVVSDSVKQAGGDIVLTAVGSPVVARKMMETGAIIGGEDNGGAIFGDHQFCRDGAMSIVRMLELIARNGSLDEQVDSLPRYHTVKAVMPCRDDLKPAVIEGMRDALKDHDLNTVDGIRIDKADGWAIMRPSGTEPKFRITSESKDEEVARGRSERLVALFEEVVSRLEAPR